MRDKLAYLLGVAIALAAILWVCSQSYDDEQDEQQHYCSMVKQKVWPDYQGTYKKYCK